MRELPRTSFELLGVKIDGLNHESAINCIQHAVTQGKSLSVAAACLQNLAYAFRDVRYRESLRSFSLILPDGAPLLWAARMRGIPLAERTYGPELMRRAIQTLPPEIKHFILGGTEEALKLCTERFHSERPGCISGTYSPPFGDWPEGENARIKEHILASKAQIVWVCLGTPLQEFWVSREVCNYPGLAFVTVGAAVDFLGGTKPQAPSWMQRAGLEWLFRLLCEPKRLWRRYLLEIPPVVFRLPFEYRRLRREFLSEDKSGSRSPEER